MVTNVRTYMIMSGISSLIFPFCYKISNTPFSLLALSDRIGLAKDLSEAIEIPPFFKDRMEKSQKGHSKEEEYPS